MSAHAVLDYYDRVCQLALSFLFSMTGWSRNGRTLETLRRCEADSRDARRRDESVVFAWTVDDENPTVQSQENRESGDDGKADRHTQNGRRVGMA
jgi:hypothetical protein